MIFSFRGSKSWNYVFGENLVDYKYGSHCNSPFMVLGIRIWGICICLPNLRHLPSRLIWISPQFGQRYFVDSLPGGIGLPQLVHVTNDSFSDITVTLLCPKYCWGSLYLLCLEKPVKYCKKQIGCIFVWLLCFGI